MLPKNLRISSKEQLNKCLMIELKFYKCSLIQRILCVSETAILRKHQLLLRKTEYYTNEHKFIRAIWYKYRLCVIQNKYSLHIPLNCCETGLHIIHIGSIIINSKAQIGKYCSLHINTAIVANGKTNDAPHLGDNVVVGIGAVIMGPIFIGNRIAIGANAVVNKNFYEENIAIAGIPARKISNNGSSEWNK